MIEKLSTTKNNMIPSWFLAFAFLFWRRHILEHLTQTPIPGQSVVTSATAIKYVISAGLQYENISHNTAYLGAGHKIYVSLIPTSGAGP